MLTSVHFFETLSHVMIFLALLEKDEWIPVRFYVLPPPTFGTANAVHGEDTTPKPPVTVASLRGVTSLQANENPTTGGLESRIARLS